MRNEPETWTLDQLIEADLGRSVVVASPSVRPFTDALPFDRAETIDALDPAPDTAIVVGGGSLMDAAKTWRFESAPECRLILVPSIWGSGAEASPVAVLNRDGHKDIRIDRRLLPDVRCYWPELAAHLPRDLVVSACGDTWAHALEAFLSPLANAELRAELAGLVRDMLELGLTNDPAWFQLSARACAAQARASVGLVHGIAHVLEGPLRRDFPRSGWGHARLCSVFLWPVMEFNRAHNDKLDRLCREHGLDSASILRAITPLHDPEAYAEALPLLDRDWTAVLRDPCSRTNSALVRPASKAYFLDREFT